ncbi:hypothetical protein PC128_g15873 [Phytophthora cactorum]|nr:hypothetical protein PC128_g15873 [Phytophthora cactorum]
MVGRDDEKARRLGEVRETVEGGIAGVLGGGQGTEEGDTPAVADDDVEGVSNKSATEESAVVVTEGRETTRVCGTAAMASGHDEDLGDEGPTVTPIGYVEPRHGA